jgi:hypothetical protein
MVSITCDACGAEKPQEEIRGDFEWILGYDLQSETANAVSRSIRFLDRWDDRRVLELGSIHLCSDECKQSYMRGKRAA